MGKFDINSEQESVPINKGDLFQLLKIVIYSMELNNLLRSEEKFEKIHKKLSTVWNLHGLVLDTFLERLNLEPFSDYLERKLKNVDHAPVGVSQFWDDYLIEHEIYTSESVETMLMDELRKDDTE